MHKSNYSLEVLINGRPAQEYYKDQKSFIEARSSTEYTLRFRNNSWKRVMAVFSVDGIEVLKGKAASEADNGYIVDAFSNIEIKGYRIDDKNVAAFKFSDVSKGYNITVGEAKVDEATGQTTYDKTSKNSGVIGVRVIEEDVPNHDYAKQYKELPKTSFSGSGIPTGSWVSLAVLTSGYNPSIVGRCISSSGGYGGHSSSILRSNINQMGQLSAIPSSLLPIRDYDQHEVSDFFALNQTGGMISSASFTSSVGPAAAPTFDTSTAWGSKLEDKIREVSFKRSNTITDLEIYYASRVSLEQFGIDFSHTKQIFAWPSAFEDKKQYCKVPAGWEGAK